MIAIDTSVLIATFTNEPDADLYRPILAGAPCLIGAPTLLETHLVLRGRSYPYALEALDLWLEEGDVTVMPHDLLQLRLAREAFDRFGKGRHPAGLNFGDCMAYAVAKAHDVPLLFKGDDFSRTDVRVLPV
ncbi:type II toxin-antitoxin system VapC family toxin [Xanthobacter oligotrophicus]|uniref:type II toxin-antitoxin system VapC family toxin n=1 Tax=Xanthobacter oligotrophicus TaxID=2607286 RepID=UPI0011F311CD|nr:type II toxin-antitoxin system VapC family toxin [Xanthobacter oligotrophicus]MCG5234927.1 type II toxin-antitoxin system VapC family toxin [Xanthobacter oligotrophicus]